MHAAKYIAAHLLWLVNAIFGVWLWFISRSMWLAAFQRFYILGSPTRETRAGLLDRVFSILLGLAWFVVVIALESYFKNGVEKDDLLRRFSKATGPILLAAFVVDLILSLIQGLNIVGWSRFAILAVELALGVVLVRAGWSKTAASKRTMQTSNMNE